MQTASEDKRGQSSDCSGWMRELLKLPLLELCGCDLIAFGMPYDLLLLIRQSNTW